VSYLYLSIAIISEVVATSTLKATEEFTRVWPSIVVVIGYALAFYFLTLTLRTIPIGIAYALWSGIGIVLVVIAGFILYNQSVDLAAVVGIGLIVLGVAVINVFSKTAMH